MALVRLTIRPWETVDVDEVELRDLENQGLVYTDNATVYVNFLMYTGGPPVDVSGVTVTVSKNSVVLTGPTSVGVNHIDTGAYGWLWGEDARDGAGDYLIEWDGTDAQDVAVHAEETITLEAS